jgi:hypothetical protein
MFGIPDIRKAMRWALGRGTETVVAVFLVLAFFLLFLALLYVLFPSGPGLRDLQDRGQVQDNRQTEAEKAVAVLSSVQNTVKNKRADSLAWETAKPGMELFDQDAVQTLQRSFATLNFGGDNNLELGANSLVIIKSLVLDRSSLERRSHLFMSEGELRGKIAGHENESAQMNITTPSVQTRIRTRDLPENKANFKITVNPDNSSTVTVYKGSAVVTAEGREVQVRSNMSVQVKQGESPPAPAPLPPTVELLAPEDSMSVVYRELSPRIEFTWKAVPGATGYHFVLARDSLLRDRAADERLAQAEFTHGYLKQGTYYWRVSALAGSVEGDFSAPRSFQVLQKKRPPALSVVFPPAMVTGRDQVVSGKTEPGVRIFVMSREARTNEVGEFRLTVELERGTNIIVVEAVDSTGNVTYRSQTVNVKF